jgi:hypothetical protein
MNNLQTIMDIYYDNFEYQLLISNPKLDSYLLAYGLYNVLGVIFLNPNITGIQGFPGLIKLFNASDDITQPLEQARRLYNNYLLSLDIIKISDIMELTAYDLTAHTIKATWILSEEVRIYYKKLLKKRRVL